MKILFLFIVIISGALLGQKKESPQIHFFRGNSQCEGKEGIPNKVTLNNVPSITDCPLVIANAGMLHSLSESESKAKIYNFFNDELKGFYAHPNESNVNTNESGPGSSAQKYDPRDDLYIRFERVETFNKKINFGIKPDISKVENLSKCNPVFNRINKNESLEFIRLLAGKTISYEAQKTSSFSFLFLMTYLFSRESEKEILNRYSMFRNNCSKAVSVILNFCLEDPRYDLQYEDMFISQDGSRSSSAIYCKKSSEKSWTLLSTKYYKLRSGS